MLNNKHISDIVFILLTSIFLLADDYHVTIYIHFAREKSKLNNSFLDKNPNFVKLY